MCKRKAMDEQQVAFRQDWASHNLAVRGEKLMEERKFEGGPKGVKGGHSAQSKERVMASKQVNAAHKEAVHSNIQEKKTKATHVQKNLIVD